MIKTIPADNTIALKYDDKTIINVKTNPTFEEKYIFTLRASEYSIVHSADYSKETISYVTANAIFDVLFFMMFTDFIFPEEAFNQEGLLDVFIAHDIIRGYNIRRNLLELGDTNINDLMDDLQCDISSRLESYEKHRIAAYGKSEATEEALENINTLINKGTTVLNALLEKINAITPDTLANSANTLLAMLEPTPKPKRQYKKKTADSNA